jgi:alginate O-acetyltransferase complex protein AlgI
MSFASISFFVFFIIVLGVMSLSNIDILHKWKYIQEFRQWFLLAASYVFYGWWDWRFCFLMFFLTLTSYWSALQKTKTKKSFYTVLGIVIPLLILAFFKYCNFFIASFAAAFAIRDVHSLSIILPVGISFYTFQTLSYTIDVSVGKIKPEYNFRRLALYIAFFPQLVAGPIVKAKDFLPQLYEERNISVKSFLEGIQIFIFGLFKKLILADYLSVFADDVFKTPRAFSGFTLMLGVVAYSLQIYFDFSGYSDMAIGCAKILGYDFIKNFNLPYISRNVSEFWKRWHISLSTWLKDYLYIPLGGNRKGNGRTYINLMLTMRLGGLWHGASWTFVAWGGLHGIALCVHKFYVKHFKFRPGGSIGFFISMLFTDIFVGFCWIFFRAGSFQTAWDYIHGILTWQKGVCQPYVWVFIAFFIACAATICAVMRKRRTNPQGSVEGYYPLLDLSRFWHLVLFFLIIAIIAGVGYTGISPFIYFQF